MGVQAVTNVAGGDADMSQASVDQVGECSVRQSIEDPAAAMAAAVVGGALQLEHVVGDALAQAGVGAQDGHEGSALGDGVSGGAGRVNGCGHKEHVENLQDGVVGQVDQVHVRFVWHNGRGCRRRRRGGRRQ